MEPSKEKNTGAAKAVFPVIRSLLSPQALLSVVADAYEIGRRARLYAAGAGTQRYVPHSDRRAGIHFARVPTHWRTEADILYELDLLRYLGDNGAAVSTPIPRRDKSLAASIEAPEGERHLALFTYALGRHAELSTDFASAFGRTIAVVHNSCRRASQIALSGSCLTSNIWCENR